MLIFATMSRFLCCCVTTNSSKEDDNVRSSDPKKRTSKGKEPPKNNEHGRATEETLSPYYTQQQLEEVEKLYLSIDPSELFLREKEIKEKVREIIAKGDKGLPVKARKWKAKKKKKKSKHKKESDTEDESQHSYPLQAAHAFPKKCDSPNTNGTGIKKGKFALLRPSGWRELYHKTMKPYEQEPARKMSEDESDASTSGAGTSAGKASGSTSGSERESSSNNEARNNTDNRTTSPTIEERLAICQQLSMRLRQRIQANEEARFRLDAIHNLPPFSSNDMHIDALSVGSEASRDDDDAHVDSDSDSSYLNAIREQLRIARENGLTNAETVSALSAELNELRELNAMDDDETWLEYSRGLESGTARFASYSTDSSRPPAADEFDRYLASDEFMNWGLVRNNRNRNSMQRPMHMRNDSVEGLMPCSSESSGDEDNGEDWRGQARTSIPLSQGRRAPNFFRTAVEMMRAAGRRRCLGTLGSFYHTSNSRSMAAPGLFFPSNSSRGHAFDTSLCAARGSHGMAPSGLFSPNSSSRSHAFESFLRSARGDHSTGTSEPPSPSDSFRGSILRELFRVVRRSRSIITPEPFPPGNLPGSNLMSGKGPKAGKVTRIVVQPCEDFQAD